MSRWHFRPRAIGLRIVSPTCAVLAVLSLLINAPIGVASSRAGPSFVGVPDPHALPANGTAALVSAGQTSLGPPGETPTGIAYDNRTGKMFVIEGGFLAVLNGSPPVLVDSVFLGEASSPESVAVDVANDTVFIGSYPSSVIVVSGTTDQVVTQLALDVSPVDLAYDPATGEVYTGGGDQYLTAINGSTYAVSSVGPAGISGFTPYAFAYDPVTRYLVLMGTQECCTGWGWGEVLSIDANTGNLSWANSTPLYDSFSGMAVDGANGSIYLTTSFGGVKVLNGTNGATLANFGMPGETSCGYPWATGMAYDATSTDILVGECGGVVRSIDTANDSVGPPISVGGLPSAIAVNTSTGNAYVVNWDTNSLAVVAANGSSVISYLIIGGAPEAVAVDNSTGTAYVFASNNVSIINLTSHARVGSIAVGVNATSLQLSGGALSPYLWASPQSILLDPLSQEVFVANSGNNTVSVISARTNAVVATIPVASEPLALAWNNETNKIYVACSGQLDIISVGTLRVEANYSMGALLPGGIAFVPSLNEIFVDTIAMFSGTTPQVSVISAATNLTVGSIPLPSNATTTGEVVYDNTTGDLYVAGAWLGLSISDTHDYIVNPEAETLVGNITVGADPDGIATNPDSTQVFATAGLNSTVSEIDGATGGVLVSAALPSDSVAEGVGYDPSTNQVLVVDWGSDTLSYLIPEEVYPVLFSETGLPNGTNWSVTLNGSTNSSTNNTTTFAEPNGTYSYSIAPVPGYSVTAPTGNVTVNGANVTASVLSPRSRLRRTRWILQNLA
jgi:YVTN family beta-propeller protein